QGRARPADRPRPGVLRRLRAVAVGRLCTESPAPPPPTALRAVPPPLRGGIALTARLAGANRGAQGAASSARKRSTSAGSVAKLVTSRTSSSPAASATPS